MTEDARPSKAKRIKPAKLAQLTTDVVAAYLSRNVTSPSDLPHLIDMVSQGLQEIGQASEEAPPTRPEPAVPVRRSISPDQLTCLVCGKASKLLKRHLAAVHKLTPAAYRELFKLKPDYPMVAPNYARLRSEMARRIGLGRKHPPRRRARRTKGS